jgi:hypothetical protein
VRPEHERPTAEPRRLDWPFPPVPLSILIVWIGWTWWREILAQCDAAATSVTLGTPASLAWLGLGARALATLSEAGIYVLWWKGRGARLAYWRLAAWIAMLSAADLFGFALGRAAEGAPTLVRISCTVLAGPLAWGGTPTVESGTMAAFGNCGVLTLVRVTMTAWAQARGVGRPLRGPLMLTVAAWLVTRLATWWSFDLVRGMSPVR